MTDTPRGPTTEELRARALAQLGTEPHRQAGEPTYTRPMPVSAAPTGEPPSVLLPRPCLACNREQGERMCDLCQRLEEAEASA